AARRASAVADLQRVGRGGVRRRPRPGVRKKRESVGSCALNYLQSFGRDVKKIEEFPLACALHHARGMDAPEFDRLLARVRNPRLIPGIYNYCDGRCPRCPLTDRCLTYLDQEDAAAGNGDRHVSFAQKVTQSVQRTLDMLAE